MGDRGNIVIVQHSGKANNSKLLYFYSHWGGHDMPETLQSALKRGGDRWGDEPYLARIIFCELVGDPKNLKDVTGLGITTYLTDNEYPLLVVDAEKMTVSSAPAERPMEPFKTVSFDDFLKLEGKALTRFRMTDEEQKEAAKDDEDDD